MPSSRRSIMTDSSLSTEYEDGDDKKEENMLITSNECDNNVAQESEIGKLMNVLYIS